MKKMMTGRARSRRLLSLWMAMLMLAACALGSGMAALAERRGIPELDIQWAAVREGGNIDMLLYSRSNSLRAVDLALSAGDSDIPIDVVEPYVGGTTWVLLVDSANVNTSDGIEPIRATIKNLLENMRNEDNGVILSIPDALSIINLKSKAQLMSAEPPTIKKDTSERRLNEAIDRALTFLETAEGVYEHAVLTVITNGKNLYDVGLNSANVITRISNEPVTVYTVVYGTQNASNGQTLDKLYRMAELSCGGACMYEKPNSGEEGAARVVSAIRNNEAHFFRAVAHVPAGGASGSELMLRTASGKNEASWALNESEKSLLVTSEEGKSESTEEDGDNKEEPDRPAEGEGGEKNEDGNNGEESAANAEEGSDEVEKKRPDVTDAPTATAEATPAPTATAEATATATATAEATATATATAEATATATATAEVTEAPTASPEATETPGIAGIFSWPPSNWKGYLAYGLIALALLAAIILIILNARKKKKKADVEETDRYSKTQVQTSPIDDRDMGYNRPVEQRKQQYYNNEICVTLVDVDNPRNRYSAYMKQNELSIGRGGVDDKGRPVAIDLRIDTDDAKLSRKHVVFQMKDGRMMVNDCSTNGIYIGDSTRRIDMPTEIHQKSILRMGNARFMVTWTMERMPYNQGGR